MAGSGTPGGPAPQEASRPGAASAGTGRSPRRRAAGAALLGGLGAVVGFLAFVEFTSGVIQGYYVPMLTDIARHLGVHDADMNLLEGAQLTVSALVVPVLSKLADRVGHRRVLLWSTAVTFAASAALAVAPGFWLFLVAWALQGFYVVWLPLEIALLYIRYRVAAEDGQPAVLTRRAAGVLVGALEAGAIAGALSAGALVEALPLQAVLAIPAVIVGLCWAVIRWGVAETPASELGGDGQPLDHRGLVLLSSAMVLLMGGLFGLRAVGFALTHPGFWAVVAAVLAAVAATVAFWRAELTHPDPLVDVRMFRDPALWPVFATTGLFGVSVLGAQVPLSTFARTDPEVYGYGLGASASQASVLIGVYLISMVVGALGMPVLARLLTPRWALIVACGLNATGYLLFLPLHHSMAQALVNVVVIGVGAGALVASLPAAAAAAAPPEQTAVATGLTNAIKTMGGAVASAVFGLALSGMLFGAGAAVDGAAAGPEGTAGSLTGYLFVWGFCAATGYAAAALLLRVPKRAFADASELTDGAVVV